MIESQPPLLPFGIIALPVVLVELANRGLDLAQREQELRSLVEPRPDALSCGRNAIAFASAGGHGSGTDSPTDAGENPARHVVRSATQTGATDPPDFPPAR